MRYNLVLAPLYFDTQNTFIQLAHEASHLPDVTPAYLLGNRSSYESLPHLSVIQFELNNSSPIFFGNSHHRALSQIWQHSLSLWQQLLMITEDRCENITVTSPRIHYKHDVNGPFEGITWGEIEISSFENPFVQLFHDRIREMLTPLGITCLNAHGDHYNPHFTLFNAPTRQLISVAELMNTVPEPYFSELTTFPVAPALGIANEQWEFTQKLYEHNSPRAKPLTTLITTSPSLNTAAPAMIDDWIEVNEEDVDSEENFVTI